MMQGSLFRANGTVALNGFCEIGYNLKLNLPTVTTPFVRSHDRLRVALTFAITGRQKQSETALLSVRVDLPCYVVFITF